MELEVFNLYDDFVVLREGDDYEVIINYVNYNIRFWCKLILEFFNILYFVS